MYKLCFSLLLALLCSISLSQGSIKGKILNGNLPVEFAQVGLEGTSFSSLTNQDGEFIIQDIPYGSYQLKIAHVSYRDTSFPLQIDSLNPSTSITINLGKKTQQLDEFVITGTRTVKRKTESPVIVNVINSQTLDNVQACNLSEGLKFQPGLRVETDCQTCNYTQLRMNGLAGGYSQILINGRPIFSPLTSLYGLEQIPVNMIDRIEIIRGGGSSLYGSSAIGGTVNVITKIPNSNGYELNLMKQSINGKTYDHVLSGNTTLMSKNKNSGVSLFFNQRDREIYDHNGDNFSELSELQNLSFGTNAFFLFGENQKLELSLSKLYEYRYGGESADKPVHEALQAEERTHNVWMGSADYQINFNEGNSSFITYLGWQQTQRDHYTGIVPDGDSAIAIHNANPPYGNSLTQTFQGGFQLNHKLKNTLGLENILTAGVEYLLDDVYDKIPAYNYLIDQETTNVGVLIQSDWKLTPSFNLLTGIRVDKHNLINNLVASPRVSFLYTYKKNTQLRLSYGSGFRAPQAFDTDLHIAFAGGGISRVQLSPTLSPERSQSYSASINYDRIRTKYILGYTFEGFYTRLNNAFFLDPIGEDDFGQVFEKTNGQGATVKGVTLELRGNYNSNLQLESGFTIQSSQFDTPVEYIEGVEATTQFIRTPNVYGYSILTLFPNSRLNGVINYVYTGKMILPHFGGAPNQPTDAMETTSSFNEVSIKVNYVIPVQQIKTKFNLYAGVRNLTNSYQSQFDIGKNRDSNFVYGPSLPRTFYLGIKMLSF